LFTANVVEATIVPMVSVPPDAEDDDPPGEAAGEQPDSAIAAMAVAAAAAITCFLKLNIVVSSGAVRSTMDRPSGEANRFRERIQQVE